MRWWREWRDSQRRQRAVDALLDELFTRPDLMSLARLAPRHRHRVTVLEIDTGADGAVTRLLFGIVRHPKPHPLAVRGDDVLELIEYRPADATLAVVGGRNLTRHPPE